MSESPPKLQRSERAECKTSSSKEQERYSSCKIDNSTREHKGSKYSQDSANSRHRESSYRPKSRTSRSSSERKSEEQSNHNKPSKYENSCHKMHSSEDPLQSKLLLHLSQGPIYYKHLLLA